MVGYQKYILYSMLVIFVILLVIMIIFGSINAVNEHEFISDLTSIKFINKNQFIDKLCGIDNCYKNNWKSPECKEIQKIFNIPLYKSNPVLSDILNIILNQKDYGSIPENTCTTKQLNNFNKYFSFSKTEARQILLNNELLIDEIYGNKNSKKYIKDVLNMIKKLLKPYPDWNSFHNDIGKSFTQISNDYLNLSTNKQKNLDIVLSKIFLTEILNISNPVDFVNYKI